MNIFRNSLFAATAMTLTLSLFSPANAADPVAGKTMFRRCMMCHTVDEGVNRVGPSLYGIVGRTPGSAAGYKFSPAMVAFGESGAVWDEATLVQYLANPRQMVVGTRMAFPGMPPEAGGSDIVAYLKTLSE